MPIRIMVNGTETIDAIAAVKEEILKFVGEGNVPVFAVQQVVPRAVLDQYPQLKGKVSKTLVEYAIEGLIAEGRIDENAYCGVGQVALTKKPPLEKDQYFAVPELPDFTSKKEYS